MRITRDQLFEVLRAAIKETLQEDDDSPFPSTKKTYGNRSFAELDARKMPRGFQKDDIVQLTWVAAEQIAKSEGQKRLIMAAKGFVAGLDKQKDDYLVVNWKYIDPDIKEVFQNLRSVPATVLNRVDPADRGQDRPVKALDRKDLRSDEPETEEIPKKRLYFGPRPT